MKNELFFMEFKLSKKEGVFEEDNSLPIKFRREFLKKLIWEKEENFHRNERLERLEKPERLEFLKYSSDSSL